MYVQLFSVAALAGEIMKTYKLLFVALTLMVSGVLHAQNVEDRKKLEQNLASIIYCKEYVLVDVDVRPKVNQQGIQVCDSAYDNFTGAISKNMSAIALEETERYARVLVDATYQTVGEERLYMKDFSRFPAELKETELPRCLRICSHFAEIKESPIVD